MKYNRRNVVRLISHLSFPVLATMELVRVTPRAFAATCKVWGKRDSVIAPLISKSDQGNDGRTLGVEKAQGNQASSKSTCRYLEESRVLGSQTNGYMKTQFCHINLLSPCDWLTGLRVKGP